MEGRYRQRLRGATSQRWIRRSVLQAKEENSYAQHPVNKHHNLNVNRIEKRRIYCVEGLWLIGSNYSADSGTESLCRNSSMGYSRSSKILVLHKTR
jgi:hypothetical protein